MKLCLRPTGKASGKDTRRILISVGRVPFTEGLGLENTRAAVDAGGFIETDSQRRTADPAIFAIGDVAGEPMLAHKATYEGRIVAEVITGAKTQYDPRAVPAVIFTDPEIALVRGHRKRGQGIGNGSGRVEISVGGLGKGPYA